ncbi:MAG: T9SS type A sorting domain-containing protein, partial [Bacteroidota bacterium]
QSNWTNIDPTSSYSSNCSGSPVFISQDILTNVLCNGDCNGDISITVSGGTPGYTYSWVGPSGYISTNEDISGLCAGTYDLTVTDGASTTSTASFTVTEPLPITITTTNITNTCGGQCDGLVSLSASGGTPVYQYIWYNGIQPAVVTNLCPGTYTVTVTDAVGCTNSLPVIISGFPQITGLNEVITDATCGLSNGSIDITVSNGAPPFTYLWSNAATSEDLSLISTGTYSVTVTDVNGCTYTDSFNVQNIAGPTSSITSQTNVLCNGNYDGTAVVAGSGGTTPYTYLWDANAGNQTTDTAINLCAGNYSVTVTDNIGCSSISIVTITEPSVLNIFNDSITNTTHGICNGSIDFSAVGGVPPYDYFWSTGDTTNTLDMLCPESYDITITDSNGCIFQTSFHVGSSYDSSYTFVDTIYVQIDTCIFNNTLPVDSALIYNYSTISQDSVLLNWVFWQDGNSILLDIGVHIDTPGSNLVYLEIDCGTKAQFAYEFYGVVDIITNLSGHKQELPDVNIYPNPTTGKITIEAEGIRNIKLLNIEGRKIYSGVDHEIDISKESKGIFIIIVTTDTGFTVRKIILE